MVGFLPQCLAGWLIGSLAGCLSEVVWYMMWFSVVAINGLAEQLRSLITPPYRAGAFPTACCNYSHISVFGRINKAGFMICRLSFWNVFTLPFESKYQLSTVCVEKFIRGVIITMPDCQRDGNASFPCAAYRSPLNLTHSSLQGLENLS